MMAKSESAMCGGLLSLSPSLFLHLLQIRRADDFSCLLMVSRDFVPLVNLISILFQIRDDYMNLQSCVLLFSFLNPFSSYRTAAEDLTP
jgi:hypothetical protein